MFGFAVVSSDDRPEADTSCEAALRNSVILTNVALAVVIGLQLVPGWGEFLLVQMPCAMIAATAGVRLFFVQHQSRTPLPGLDEWSYADGAARQLPSSRQAVAVLHRQHRPPSRPPPERPDSNYNLQRAHDEKPVFTTRR